LQDEANRALIALRNQLAGQPPEPPPEKAPLPSGEAALGERREAGLVKWETATGGLRSHLYSRRHRYDPRRRCWSPVISKNQFYAWLRGKIPTGAKASRRLEAFLDAKGTFSQGL
jgi:hypothetical protein